MFWTKLSEWDLPSFRDSETGLVMVWDPTSHTYVQKPGSADERPDRSHATGGDNDLFSPDTLYHSEKTKNPMMEGILAAYDPQGHITAVNCPNCDLGTDEHVCPQCGKDLTPEWNSRDNQRPGEEFDEQLPQHDIIPSEMRSWVDRVDKRNRQQVDDWPSMMSSVKQSNEWAPDMSSDIWNYRVPFYLYPNGKSLVGFPGQQHSDLPGSGDPSHQGMFTFHPQYGAIEQWPIDKETMQEPPWLNDDLKNNVRKAAQQRWDSSQNNQNYNKSSSASRIKSDSGENLTRTKPAFFSHYLEELEWNDHVANSKTINNCPECHTPMVERDGNKECVDCGLKQKIVEAAFLAPLGELAGGIGGAAGGAGAMGVAPGAVAGGTGVGQMGQLMNQAMSGGPSQAGPSQGQAETSPSSGASMPDTNSGAALQGVTSAYDDMDPRVMDQQANPEYKNWLEGQGSTEPCIYCGGQTNHGLCRDCGEPQNSDFLPQENWDDWNDSGLPPGPDLSDYNRHGPLTAGYPAKTFGENEVGNAQKNRGDNSDPDNFGSGDQNAKEFGDSPEQLKDVGGPGGSKDSLGQDGASKVKDQAMQSFEDNKPLVLEFAMSDKSGKDHPVLQQLDQLLESVFPGYKEGGQDGQDEGHDSDLFDSLIEHPMEDLGKEEKPTNPLDADRDHKKAFRNSFWNDEHIAGGYGMGMGTPGVPSMPGAPAAQNPGISPGGSYTCPQCGQAHKAGSPCPTTPGQQQGLGPQANGMGGTPGAGMGMMAGYNMNQGIQQTPETLPQLPDQTGGPACPNCGQNHDPQAPCMPAQAPGAANALGGQASATPISVGMQPMTPRIPQKVVTNYNDFGDWQDPTIKLADTSNLDPQQPHQHPHHEEHNPHHDTLGQSSQDPYTTDNSWVDDSGTPLTEGQEYELRSSNYAIPDRITVNKILPDKIMYTMHSGDMDYQDEMTKEDLSTNGYSFTPANDSFVDSEGGSDMGDIPPVRPGQDATPQVDDQSTPFTHASSVMTGSFSRDTSTEEYVGSFRGDNPTSRSWITEGSGSVDVDPVLMSRIAGKHFSPSEQRELIDEEGNARNLSSLNLEGTHYADEDGLHLQDSLW